MDQFGSVQLSWCVGYTGQPAHYANESTICYLNDTCIKLLKPSEESVTYLRSPGDGVGTLAVNSLYGYLAFSEEGQNARIFVYSIFDLDKPQSTLKGSSQLGYSSIAFANNGSTLACCSDVPEVKVTVWNWCEEKELCRFDVSSSIPFNQLNFNPMNWRQLSGSSDSAFSIWNIEQVNEGNHLVEKCYELPFANGAFGVELYEDDTDRPTTGHGVLRLTKSAIAGISSAEINYFDPGNTEILCEPVSHCWGPDGQVIIGCAGGQLLVADAETNTLTVLFIAQKDAYEEGDPLKEMGPGCFDCLALHKNGLFTAGRDGMLRCLRIDNDEIAITYCQPCGEEISSLALSPNYEKIVIGTVQGTVMVHEIWKSLTPLFSDGDGEIIGVSCLLDGNQYAVIGRSNGLIQVWNVLSSKLSGQIDLQYEICSLVCPASSSLVILGTTDGALLAVDVTNMEQMKCVYKTYIHKAAVTCLKTDDQGKLLLSGSTDGHLFIMDSQLSTNFNVIGYTEVAGDILCLSSVYLKENGTESWKILAGVSSSAHQPACNQLVELEVPKKLVSCPPEAYMDSTRLLKDISVQKRTYLLKNYIYDIACVSKTLAFAIIHHGKKIAKFTFDEFEETPTNLVMEASYTYPGHGLTNGQIISSCHHKWLVSSAPDGYLIFRAVGAMNNTVMLQAGNYRTGGLSHVCFTGDAQKVITASYNGGISCWEWKFSALGKTKAANAIDTFRSRTSTLNRGRKEQDALITAMEAVNLEVEMKVETWLEKAIEEAHRKEDEIYSNEKRVIRDDFQNLRTQILALMSTNDGLPDIEKLNRQEFILDVEEKQHLVNEREKNLANLRYQKELENVSKQYIRQKIKEECWDQMAVKGRVLSGFQLPVQVTNYSMRERSKVEEGEFEFATKQRELEIMEEKTRVEVMKSDLAVYAPLVEQQKVGEGDDDVHESDGTKENAATYGSLGFTYGGHNPLLQSQFNLHTSQQKRHQIALLKDCIYKIKTTFNKQFDEVLKAKDTEIRRIQERNTRIQKIVKDLELEDDNLMLEMTENDCPESLLEVRDDEITVEKFISEEERKRLEEEARLEEERRLAENADDLRGRALEMMMAGRLETNLEEELKKELEQPEFMSKPQDDWSEEEQKLAKEFEKKQQALKEERDKYRKSLETELKKLQSANADGTMAFDEKLNGLFQRKIKTEMVINQEELKILRLVASILIDEELDAREKELLDFLDKKKTDKQQSNLVVGDAKREVEAFKDEYELLVADDRMLDKMFRREFSELDTHTVDNLYRLFKRRPRAQKTLKAATSSHADGLSIDGSPFQVRPSSSRAHSAAVASLEASMKELDTVDHMPENIDDATWNKLVLVRRQKVEKEQQVKAKALVLAEMNAYLQRQIDKDESLKFEIENTFHDIQRLREERLKFNLNLEVQLVLKQGQVEISSVENVADFSDSILIHRSAVEDLNATIKTLGEGKLASMRESKEFRKGIHLLEWELKESFMKAEDCQTAARDLQLLRVTKELQAYLGDENHHLSKQQEIQTLEKTLEVYKNMHKRNVQDRQRIINKLKRQIREKKNENKKYDVNLEEMSVSVVERRNINEVNADQSKEAGASRRMQDIITRRKLVDLAKAQAQEIAMLRAEVERLRMRTFPALVQVEPH